METQLGEERLKPDDFGSGVGHGLAFGFDTRSRDGRLLLRASRNQIPAKEDGVAAGGPSIGHVASPICVAKGM